MEKIKHKLIHAELLALYEFFKEVEINQKTNHEIQDAALQLEVLTKIKTKMVEEKTTYKLQVTLAEAIAMNSLINQYELTPNLWMNHFIVRIMVDNDRFIANFRTAPLRKQIQ